jgi:ATP-binding cassette subfamily B protein
MRARTWRSEDRLLVATARRGGVWLVAVSLGTLVLAGAQVVVPAVLGRALDAAIGHAPRTWLVWAVALVVLVGAGDALGQLADGAAVARSTAWLRRGLLRRILGLGTARSLRFGAGELASRLSGNADGAGRVAPDVVRYCAGLVSAVGALVALALIDLRLCLTFLAGVPVLLLALRTFAGRASGIARRYLDVQGLIAARLVDALSGARTIAAAGTVAREAERVLAPLPELSALGMQAWREQTRIQVQGALILPLLQLAVLAVAGFRLAHGHITVGQMFAAAQYVMLASGGISGVAVVNQLTRARAGARRALDVLEEPVVEYGDEKLPPGPGRIDVRGVSVTVEGRPVLDDVSLCIPAGVLIAVVGRSGSGKSTLAALVARLIDPHRGEVLLDGVPLSRLRKADLRRAVAYGFERPVLVGETLADVIAFGEDRPSPEAVVEAARAAQADFFIHRMPEGYGTRLLDAPMSGGEAQRVGLARAFAHAGRVVVLDDVAASLDVATEQSITRALTAELGDRTRLVVAHRASTAARADMVVWLDHGRVRGVDTHRRLWQDPEYRALFAPGEAAPEKAEPLVPAGSES